MTAARLGLPVLAGAAKGDIYVTILQQSQRTILGPIQVKLHLQHTQLNYCTTRRYFYLSPVLNRKQNFWVTVRLLQWK